MTTIYVTPNSKFFVMEALKFLHPGAINGTPDLTFKKDDCELIDDHFLDLFLLDFLFKDTRRLDNVFLTFLDFLTDLDLDFLDLLFKRDLLDLLSFLDLRAFLFLPPLPVFSSLLL